MTRRAIAVRVAAAMLVFVAAAVTVGVLIVQSAWFHDQVRLRIIQEIESATGGRVELASFSFDWRAMRAEVRGVTVRGLEPAGEEPLFRAASIAVGLKIVSALRRDIDIAMLHVRAPRVNVIVDAQGRTNIPEPKVARRSTRPVEQFLKLAIDELRISQGQFRYRSRVTPLDVAGQQIFLRLLYEREGPGYRGDLQARSLRVTAPLAVPVAFDAAFALHLTRDRVQLDNVQLKSGQSRVNASAVIESFENPRLGAVFEGNGALADFAPAFRIPLRREGSAKFSGKLDYSGATSWLIDGSLSAAGLGLDRGWLHLRGISAQSPFQITPERLELPSLRASVLGGRFDGRLSLAKWDAYKVDGRVDGFALQRLKETMTNWRPELSRFAWSGAVSGPIAVSGSLRDAWQLKLNADLAIKAGSQGVPMSGLVAMEYDYRANRLVFRDSHLEMPSSRVHFNGSLEKAIELGIFTRNFDDFLPALPLFSEQPPASMPARLQRGAATFQGKVTGTLNDLAVSGRLDTGSVIIADRTLRELSANLEVSSSQLRVTRVAAEQDTLRLDGFATIGLDRWRITGSSTVAGQISLRQGRIEQLLAENQVDWPVRGSISGFVDARGTIDTPRGSGAFTITGLEAYEETLDRVDGEFRLSSTLLEIPAIRARKGATTLEASGSYERRGENWKSGELRFDVSSSGMKLAPWNAVTRFQPNLDASVAGKLTGSARLVGGRPELTALDGDLRLGDIAVSGRDLGDATLSSRTSGRLVTVLMTGAFGEAKVNGRAEWSLTANSFGLGQVQVTNLTFVTLRNLGLFGDPNRELPFRGGLDGEIGFSGPILDPQNWTGAAKITRLAIEPLARGVVRQQDVERLTLRNREPVLAHLDSRGLHLQQARLVAEATDLELSGTVGYRGRAAWNLQLRGSLNLPVLGMLEPDVVADGRSTIDALIRGNLASPQITGRMALMDASFYVRDFPNGLDKANGVIRFDRTRATIEKLTAQTGGGDLDLSGFIGFGGEELVYRLQASARRVRVRYPEAVSTTFDAALSLTGTTSRRLLSGTVRVNRVGINPRTDIGSLLAETGRTATPTTVSNPFLRGMQLDIHVQTSPDAEFQTSLTRDIQPEADLRLRGTATRPVVLGRISVNQGEIQFFGTEYTITRGDVSFFNPVKVEPVLNLDLETRVRGITVTINFNGPIDKLAMSYRSDPPLQSSEIIALLTVGRAPGSTVTGTSSTNPSQSFLTAGSNSLLGQAMAAPISGRLQRLFGVSRLKIDPELTGITNTPQARLTVEQQLSREVTVTYITNLNRTQQQLVRLQWDFSRDFSLLAVRDENGIFGVDFLYRRRFR